MSSIIKEVQMDGASGKNAREEKCLQEFDAVT
jgi:hypothetical protein